MTYHESLWVMALIFLATAWGLHLLGKHVPPK